MAVQVLSQGSGIKLNSVRFDSGGECITALLGGHAKATFGNPLEYLGHLEAGRVRALGVFRETRFDRLPDIPTLKEQGLSIPAYQMWRGVGAPAGIPEETAAYWEDVLAKVATSPRMKKYIEENSATLVAQRGKDFAAYLQEQDAMYRKILNA
jgi:putative tricarboxylic transport membrane protein